MDIQSFSEIARFLSLAPKSLDLLADRYCSPPNQISEIAKNESRDADFLSLVWSIREVLILDPVRFTKIWDWSPLFQIVNLGLKSEYDSPKLELVRKYARDCISIITGCRENYRLSIILGEDVHGDPRFDSLYLDEENYQCVEWSSSRTKRFAASRGVDAYGEISERDGVNNMFNKHFSEQIVEICGIPIPKGKRNPSVPVPQGTEYVQVANARLYLKECARTLSMNAPLLIEGPPGCGKSVLAAELAFQAGCFDRVILHLGDQTDSKVLMGSYVCTETPGEFIWKPGVLYTAAKEGRWLIIEDIELAASDVLSALLSLLESRVLSIPQRGEMIRASPGFQIIATRTTTSFSKFGFLLGRDLWQTIQLDPLTSTELLEVCQTLFPALSPILQRLLTVFSNLCTMSDDFEKNGDGSLRGVSIRDLIKWCRRIQIIHGDSIDIHGMSVPALNAIFVEALDVFVSAVPDSETCAMLATKIGSELGLAADRVQLYVEGRYRPPVWKHRSESNLRIGRILLPTGTLGTNRSKTRFAQTSQSLRLLERIAACVCMTEPCLLVGETGTGKTAVIQYIAESIGRELIVQNLSQQSESTDLLGGYRPVELKAIMLTTFTQFVHLFTKIFSESANQKYLNRLQDFVSRQDWDRLTSGLSTGLKTIERKLFDETATAVDSDLLTSFHALVGTVSRLRPKGGSKSRRAGFAFSFVEGKVVKALREGHWLLLDEINLASAETIEALSGLLDSTGGSVCLAERGDTDPIARHPDFRLFACMNPPTDVGKKALPPGLRSRFTEIYVDEMTDETDLGSVVRSYLDGVVPDDMFENIVSFYLQARHLAGPESSLTDGAGSRPHYSLRSLTRSLEFARVSSPVYGPRSAMYEGLQMCFVTQLAQENVTNLEKLLKSSVLQSGTNQLQRPRKPSSSVIQFERFWIEKGNFSVQSESDLSSYVLTKSIRRRLLDLARCCVIRRYPVLLQGPTSAGKTSLIEYLAARTGHRFVRINNHEHTDLSEYLGTYAADTTGELVFNEGILVQAVRNGYWIVLDELNLAPSEILEALNRLLDDNRELFVPETQEVIHPHPHFMLFATQNPPGIYGGRKVLSRAFRNRFLEVNVEDIPIDELIDILERRCSMAPSWSRKLVESMDELHRLRQSTQVFAGRHAFITPRDLFRLGDRRPGVLQDLVNEAYMLTAERLRKDEEKLVVQSVLEKRFKTSVTVSSVYGSCMMKNASLTPTDDQSVSKSIVWIKSMGRLFALLERALRHKEPILLVGGTGIGKTTACQLYSEIVGQRLVMLNCHQHTDAADFLGSVHPVRSGSSLTGRIRDLSLKFCTEIEMLHIAESAKFQSQIESLGVLEIEEMLDNIWRQIISSLVNRIGHVKAAFLFSLKRQISNLITKQRTIFQWEDGPLLSSMKRGNILLIDEISLSEDSVLERLNSVLEPLRLIVLPEKGGAEIEEYTAHPDFRILATMNPGGDFGKRELSPALRNRFTEIWVPEISEHEELKMIIDRSIRVSQPDGISLSASILSFLTWYRSITGNRRIVSLRDLITWVSFINICVESANIDVCTAYAHGAALVLLDGVQYISDLDYAAVGLPTPVTKTVDSFKKCAVNVLANEMPASFRAQINKSFAYEVGREHSAETLKVMDHTVGVNPFFIDRGIATRTDTSHVLDAPTTGRNVFRLLRALQLQKPVMLEGSPGVGKTTLVEALGAISGHKIVRINLSDQTEMMDLLGADLPVETNDQNAGEFAWRDGVFLRALQAGDWVILDEVNLASQSVVEGLNSVLDHRGEVFIPELGTSYQSPDTFRVFACQNPLSQGGGRKGLPKSFLNRFTQVYLSEFTEEDLLFITSRLYPTIPAPTLSKMLDFNEAIKKAAEGSGEDSFIVRGGVPWEFNLRDVMRWCELLVDCSERMDMIWYSARVIYLQRMRRPEHRIHLRTIFEKTFGSIEGCVDAALMNISSSQISVGIGSVPRKQFITPQASLAFADATTARHSSTHIEDSSVLPSRLVALEALCVSVSHGWVSMVSGPDGSGKTTLIRQLAAFTGHELMELSMSSAVDTTELLGGFEQIDSSRKWQVLYKECLVVVPSCIGLLAVAASQMGVSKSNELMEKCRAIWSRWYEVGKFLEVTEFAEGVLKKLDHVLSNVLINLGNIEEEKVRKEDISIAVTRINELRQGIKTCKASESKLTGHFSWCDGVLVRALEEGSWLLLDNANLCSPAVLDRLNPLLEPSGVLHLTEQGLVDGEVRTIVPHSDFRLFLSFDETHGELSRALRNRGIEIALLPLSTIIPSTPSSGSLHDPVELAVELASWIPDESYLNNSGVTDLISVVKDRGIVAGDVVLAMAHFHGLLLSIAGMTTAVASAPYFRSLIHWADIAVDQILSGSELLKALRSGLVRAYSGCLAIHVGLYRESMPERTVVQGLVMIFDRTFEKLLHHYQSLFTDPSENISLHHSFCVLTAFPGMSHQHTLDLSVCSIRTQRKDDLKYLRLLLDFHDANILWVINKVKAGFVPRSVLERGLLLLHPVFLSNPPVDQLFGHIESVFVPLWTNLCVLLPQMFQVLLESEIQGSEDLKSTVSYNSIIDARDTLSPYLPHHCLHLFGEILHLRSNIVDIIDRNQLQYGFLTEDDILNGRKFIVPFTLHRTIQRARELAHCYAGEHILKSMGTGLPGAKLDLSMFNGMQRGYIQGILTGTSVSTPLDAAYEGLVAFIDLVDAETKGMLNDVGPKDLNIINSRDALVRVLINPVASIEMLFLHLVRIGKDLDGWERNSRGVLLSSLQRNYEVLKTAVGLESIELGGLKKHANNVWKFFKRQSAAPSDQKLSQLLMNFELYSLQIQPKYIENDETLKNEYEGKNIMSENECRSVLVDAMTTVRCVISSFGIESGYKQTDKEILTVVTAMESLDSRLTKEIGSIVKQVVRPEAKNDHVWQIQEIALLRNALSLVVSLMAKAMDKFVLGYDWDQDRSIERRLETLIQTCSMPGPTLINDILGLKELLWRVTAKNYDSLPSLLEEALGSILWHVQHRIVISDGNEESEGLVHNLGTVSTALQVGVLSDAVAEWNKRGIGVIDSTLVKIQSSSIALTNVDESMTDISREQHALFSSFCLLISTFTPYFDRIQFERIIKYLEELRGSILHSVCIISPSLDVWDELIGSCTDERVVNHLSKILHTIIELFVKSHNTHIDLENRVICGQIGILLGAVRFIMMVPTAPADPATKSLIRLEYVRSRIREIEAELSVRLCQAGSITGFIGPDCARVDAKIVLLKENLQKYKEEEKTVALLVPSRPIPSQFSGLFKDIHDFLRGQMSPSRVLSLTESLPRTMEPGAALTWAAICQSFQDRLYDRYPMYHDVTEPLVNSISQSVHGMKMIDDAIRVFHSVSPAVVLSNDFSNFETLMQELFHFPLHVHSSSAFDSIVKLVQEFPMDKVYRIVMACGISSNFLSVWESVLFIALHRVGVSWKMHGNSVSFLESVSGVLNSMFSAWKHGSKLIKHAELHDTLMSGIAKHSDWLASIRSSHDDESVQRSMFPTYDESFAELIKKPDMLDEDVPPSEPTPVETPESDLKQSLWRIFQFHSHHFECISQADPKHSTSSDILGAFGSVLSDSQRLGMEIMSDTPLLRHMFGSDFDNQARFSSFIALKRLSDSISSFKTNTSYPWQSSSSFNLYKDPYVFETGKCVVFLKSLGFRLDELLVEFVDHPGLETIRKAVNKMLSVPSTAPVMEVLRGLELLLQNAEVLWEEYASKSVSLVSYLQPISDLVKKWRRMEFDSWSSILDSTSLSLAQQPVQYWYHLYGIIFEIDVEQFTEDEQIYAFLSKLFSLFDTFLTKSTLADYSVRIKMIASLGTHLGLLYSNSFVHQHLANYMKNLAKFHSQYLPMVNDATLKKRETVSAELKEQCKLAHWSDKNYVMLREAAQRSHKKIVKLNRVWEEQLSVPMLSAVGPPSDPLVDSDDTAEPIILENILVPDDLVPHVSEDCNEFLSVAVEKAGETEALATSIIVRAKSLKNMTGKTKSVKRKALIDLMKYFDGIGLEHFRRDSFIESNNMHRIFDSLETQTHPTHERADNYYFKCVKWLQLLRSGAVSFSNDFTVADVARQCGYAEHLFAWISRQRKALSSYELVASACSSVLSSSDLSDNGFVPTEYISIWVKSQNDVLCALHEQFTIALLLDESGVLAGNSSGKKLVEMAPQALTIINECQVALTSLPLNGVVCDISILSTISGNFSRISNGIVIDSDDHVKGYVKVIDDIRELAEKYSVWSERIKSIFGVSNEHVDTGAILRPINIVDSVLADICSLAAMFDSPSDLLRRPIHDLDNCKSQFESGVFEFHNSVKRLIAPYFDQFLPLSDTDISETSISIRPIPIPISLVEAIRSAQSTLHNKCSIFSKVLSILLSKIWCIHEAHCKLEYVVLRLFVALQSQGFCQTEEDGEGGEGEGEEGDFEFDDGTGMVEGKGLNDVSEQIENVEEQLMGTRDEKPEEQEEDDDDKADEKGITTEHDFEGDVKEKPTEEQEEEEEGEEANDSEHEMDDVDGGEKDQAKNMDEDEGKDMKEDETNVETEGQDSELQAKEEKAEEQPTKLETDRDEDTEMKDQEEGEEEDEDKEGEEIEEVPSGFQGELGAPDEEEDKKEDDQDLPEDMQIDDMEGASQGSDIDSDDEGSERSEEVQQEDAQPDGSEDEDSEEPETRKLLSEDLPPSGAPEQEKGENTGGTAGEGAAQQEADQNEQHEMEVEDTPDVGPGQQARGTAQAQTGSDSRKGKQVTEEEKGENAQERDPNPMRSLGDAAQIWQKRMAIMNEQELEDNEEGEGDEEGQEDHEFVKIGEEEEEKDKNALGPATEEQAKEGVLNEQIRHADEEVEEEEVSSDVELQDMDSVDGELEEDEYARRLKMAIERDKSEDPESDDDSVKEMKEEDMKQIESGEKSVQIASSFMHTVTPADSMVIDEEAGHRESLLVDARTKVQNDGVIHSLEETDSEVWRKHCESVSDLAGDLGEQLRLILEPTLCARLKGDYRTGKRLNMKKVVQYVASDFKKDKIWLRRTRPSKREYQIVLAIDNSSSMAHNHAGEMALQALALISSALSRVEVGDLAICSFGTDVSLLHNFGLPFDTGAGSRAVSNFKFDEQSTDVERLLSYTAALFETSKAVPKVGLSTSSTTYLQLLFVVSDARIVQNRDTIHGWIRELQSHNQLVVLIIIDNPDSQDSVLDLQVASYPDGKLKLTEYLAGFPFPYYVVLRDLKHLPHVLSDALRQWFSLTSTQS